MTKTVNKKRTVNMPHSIKKKFSAALCMLLISAIMLVSSTYAWFTLSTAPEVTGITTNVGANGNLEIALLNGESYLSQEENLGIISNVGDSMDTAETTVTKSNETWGNLVDLSDSSYGLAGMTLMPARLNMNGSTILESPLLAPSYGSDGRVIDINTQTMLGTLVGNGYEYNTSEAGVRVIGTSSGVTVRISAYRAALSGAKVAMSNAQTAADSSLENEAQNIATILVDYVQGKDSFDVSALSMMQNIITGVSNANAYAATAIKQAALAYTLSATGKEDLGDEEVIALQTAVNEATLDNLSSVSEILLPEGTSDAITTYKETVTALETAQTNLNDLVAKSEGSTDVPAQTSFTWEEINTVFTHLVDNEQMYVNGYQAIGTNKDAIINGIIPEDGDISKINVEIEMKDGSGVYYNIAEMCGNYTVSTKVKVTYNGISASAPTTMKTGATDPSLPKAIEAIQTAGAPSENAGENTKVAISDTYGYIIDFGFRTNAAGSSLKLQTEATQRVYDDSTATATMGLGSRMTFTSKDPDNYTVDDMRALMSAIRVAFVVPEVGTEGTENNYTLLAIGALDITATTDDAKGVTTYTGGTNEVVEGNTIKEDLVLYNHTLNADGTITLGDKKTDSILTALEQNVAKKVSVIVYLDGDLVDNTMVANAEQSMYGMLNLQFSSTTGLKPMENSALRNYTETTTE